MFDSGDDTPQLSAHALAALQEFYAEQNAAEERLVSTPGFPDAKDMPKEDWQLSQFWYSEETADVLTKEAVAAAGPTGRVACISCPTLYKKLLSVKPDGCQAIILEYDERFQMFGDDFIKYDYNQPLQIPADYEKAFDLVVADPPFLSEECLSKTSDTMKFMAKDKVLLCTGATMEELAAKLLGVKVCGFIPHHANNLANEFRCYTNYQSTYLNS